MKRTIILTALAVTVTGTTLFGISQAVAQTPEDQPFTTLVQKIADKFNLNKTDVQAVFDEHRQEMHSQMEAKFGERLDQLVSEGKITEAQKQLIITRHKELEANRESLMESMKDKTPEERKQAMEAHREELEKWAEQNGIDLQYLRGGMKGMHGGMGHRFMMKTDSPVPTQ